MGMNKYLNTAAIENNNIHETLKLAVKRLLIKIRKIDLNRIGISEYNQKYINQILASPENILQRYSYLLELALKNTKNWNKNFALVDYGGGSGLLSLLAVEAGIRTVIYNDIYEISCDDIKKLSQALEIKISDFVCGDIDRLISFVHKSLITIDAVVSYDVIEHIYDIEGYLKKLQLLSKSPIRLVFGSGANIKNLFYKPKIMKKHRMCEYQDRKWYKGHKGRDTLKGYFKVRKEIISKYEPKLNEAEIQRLAYLTRGLIKNDIEKYIDEFKLKKNISYRPNHPTNTCDPYTGNWAEHLMDTDWLKNILIKEGFKAKILCGLYDNDGKFFIKLLKKIQNFFIKYFASKALIISPYYIVYATNHTLKENLSDYRYKTEI